MKSKRFRKLFAYMLMLQSILILFALFIEKIIDLIVKKYKISSKMEILIIIVGLLIGVFAIRMISRQLYTLLTFDPIAKSIFSDEQKDDFLKLLKKISNKKELTKSENIRLQLYIDNSPLPTDFIEKQTKKDEFTIWQRIGLILTIIYILLFIRKGKS